MKEISIVIPIYNVENYLEECLESVYKLNLNKEVILVNDESPDNSHLIMEKYKKKYSKETICIYQKNQGLSGARNTGLKLAKGKYIAFIDSDDFIDTEKYQEFFKKGQKENLDIILGSHIKYKNGKYLENIKQKIKIEKLKINSGKVYFTTLVKTKSFKEEVWDDIYKREFLIRNSLKFKQGLIHEDMLFSVQALSKAEKVKYYNIPIYIYRQREGSIMSSISDKNCQHKLYIVKNLLELEEKQLIELDKLDNLLLSILWGIFVNQKQINIKLLKKILNRKNKFSIKEYIKIFVMLLAKIKCQTIEPIEFNKIIKRED
ncbi:MAG: glycosyltransferase [Cetobacterium sp.]